MSSPEISLPSVLDPESGDPNPNEILRDKLRAAAILGAIAVRESTPDTFPQPSAANDDLRRVAAQATEGVTKS